MRTRHATLTGVAATLALCFSVQVSAEPTPFYNPSNTASKDGKTGGYELFKTIGCPGRQLLDPPCKEDAPAAKAMPKAEPAPAPAPKDTDGDGVLDGTDQCPHTPKGEKVNAQGCPLDSDMDGVHDGNDKCPGTPSGIKVDASGCPLPVDSDGDGVDDDADQCPNTPKGASVNDKGCPLDSDGDGVVDAADQCPDTPTGDKVDAQGCSLVSFDNVWFDLDRDLLRPVSVAVLDGVATAMARYPQLRIEIGGHTDSDNTDAYNMDLSQRRASRVRDYLIGKGVDAARMSAVGYGESQPIAPNDTEANKAQNRRVEIHPAR